MDWLFMFPALICGIISVESGGNPKAISPVGAVGLMQIMPRTGKMYGVNPRELLNAGLNQKVGMRYFSDLLKRYKGDIHKSLTAYNRGPSKTKGPTPYSYKVIQKARGCYDNTVAQ